jgi:excisionase family DNA binding protein
MTVAVMETCDRAAAAGKWLTTEQACEYLQVSRLTLKRWRQAGSVPCYWLGKSLRYWSLDLDAMIRAARRA